MLVERLMLKGYFVKHFLLLSYILFSPLCFGNHDSRSSVFTQISASKIRTIKKGWFISRIVLRNDRFSYVNNYATGPCELAAAIEPFYYLQSYSKERFLISTPVKEIKRVKNSFLVYTLSGSVYKLPRNSLQIINSIENFKENIGIGELNVYRRRELSEIKHDIDNIRILNGQNYKTWIPYVYAQSDEDIFNFSNILKQIKDKQKFTFELSQDDINIINSF
jgi:hypothetical protein